MRSFLLTLDACQFLVHSDLASKPDWRRDLVLSQKGLRDFRRVVGTEVKSSWMGRSGFDAQRFHCFSVFAICQILEGWIVTTPGVTVLG